MLQFETLVKAAGITDEALLRSPAISAAIGRMDGTKVAAAATTIEFGRPDVSLEEMLTEIGTKLAMAHLRQRQIDAGLASLDVLTGTTKEANILSRLLGRAAPAAARAGQAAHAAEAAVPAAQQMTHLFSAGPGHMPQLSPRSFVDALPAGSTLEIPAYARGVAEGGSFVPKELPMKRPVAAAPAPAGALRTKARPTMSMPAAEMPAMHTRTGTGGVSRAVNMGPGGAGILPAAPKPGGATTFQGVPGAGAGSVEAPAMFNLADLMKGQKHANAATNVASDVMNEAQLKNNLEGVLRGIRNSMSTGGAITGGIYGASTADEDESALARGLIGMAGGGILGGLVTPYTTTLGMGAGGLAGAGAGGLADLVMQPKQPVGTAIGGLAGMGAGGLAGLGIGTLGSGVGAVKGYDALTAPRGGEKTAVSTEWIRDMVGNYAAHGAGSSTARLGRLQQVAADNLHRSDILTSAMTQDPALRSRLNDPFRKRLQLGMRSMQETMPDAALPTRIQNEARDNTARELLQSLHTQRAPAPAVVDPKSQIDDAMAYFAAKKKLHERSLAKRVREIPEVEEGPLGFTPAHY